MTTDDLVEQRLDFEGRVYAEPPAIDQPTGPGGVTLSTLAAWRRQPVSVADLRALTVDEAALILRAAIQRDLVQYGFDQITFEPLRVQCLDYAWNSGSERAIRWLQRTLGIAESAVTGVFDAR